MIGIQQQSRSGGVRYKGQAETRRTRSTRGLTLLVLLGLMPTSGLAPQIAAAQTGPASEYELKAAMLYKLTRFVEWPPAVYRDPKAPMVLCILGRDPFGDFLTSIASSQTTDGRPVEIRHARNNKEVRACHVIYISSSERKSIGEILSALRGYSVLSVGEMAQFAAHGGMVQFSLDDRQVHFEINLEAASRADIKISSRLLALARIVKSQSSELNGPAWPVLVSEKTSLERGSRR